MSNIIRPYFLAPVAVALLAALALVGLVYAQDSRPGTPTNLSVSPSDTEATITWVAPVGGEGACEPTDYEAWVERLSDGDITGGSEVNSPWTATGLEPSTEYEVTVYTYSLECDEYSAEPAQAKFSTTASDEADAEEPDEKHEPKRVRRLRAAGGIGEDNSV